MSGTGGNDAILLGALKEFHACWERNAAAWKDKAREEFWRDYVQDVVEAVRSASNAISQIEVLLRQVHKECS